MPVDTALVGRTFPAPASLTVTEERVSAFARSLGQDRVGAAGDAVPPTFPIVLAFEAMQSFLDAAQVDLFRIVHGEQRFTYERPLRVGDELTATLEVTGVRHIGGADIIATASQFRDAAGDLVCTGRATLVHGGVE